MRNRRRDLLNKPLLIYGATGFTGQLIVAEAMARGVPVILGGRHARVHELAKRLAVPSRLFTVASDAADAALRECSAILNCAGPFSQTATPLVERCLRMGTHYLDINGEVGVFEALAEHDDHAQAAGIVLLPGVGFDVVPTDCLAAMLTARLPTATRLTLVFRVAGAVSHGTLHAMLENVDQAGLERRDGRLVPVRPGLARMTVDFGSGSERAFQVAWGDLATAYRSTGIGNIQTFAVPSLGWRLVLSATAKLARPLSHSLVQRIANALIPSLPKGPSVRARQKLHSEVWGQVQDSNGRTATARLRAPEPYLLTTLTAVTAAQRVMKGTVHPGFHTPSSALGREFILEFVDVRYETL